VAISGMVKLFECLVITWIIGASAAFADDPKSLRDSVCSPLLASFRKDYPTPNKLPPSNLGFFKRIDLGPGRLVVHCLAAGDANVDWDGYYYLAFDRQKQEWRSEEVGSSGCATLAETEQGFSLKVPDHCAMHAGNPPPCRYDLYEFRVQLDGQLQRMKTVIQTPLCKICPKRVGCVKPLRVAADAAYKAGNPKVGVEILRSLIDGYFYLDDEQGTQTIDPWVLSDLLLYTVKAGLDCRGIGENYKNYATLTGDAAKAFVHNRELCEKSRP